MAVAAPALAQDAPTAASGESAADTYARVLQQISDTETNIMRQEMLLERQAEQIAALRDQVAQTPARNAEVRPILQRFAGRLEQALEADVPFQLDERFERLNRFNEILGDEEARLAEQMARALQVANIEVNYGYEVVSYAGDHPLDPRRRFNACVEDTESEACALTDELREDLEAGASLPQLDTEILDGDYVRYGRLSLAYVDRGTDDILVYDARPDAEAPWREARGSERSGINRNLRIARGEAAPDLIEAPVVKTN